MSFTTDSATYPNTSGITVTFTGIAKGNGSGLVAALSGVDYAPATSGSVVLKGNGSGGFAAAANSDLPAMSSTVGGAVPTPPNNTTTFLRGDGTWATPPSGISVINGWINGFTLSNDAGTPNTVLDIAAGYAADSTNATMITGTAFTKTTGGSWAAGTGNAGMGTGLTIANSTWYHVFAIINNGNYDVYFDTSATAANKPASTTAFRYIGSFKTDASAHILKFFQFGQKFLWAASVADISSGATTLAALYPLSAPLGFVTYPIFITVIGGTSNVTAWSAALGASYAATTIYGGGGGGLGIPWPAETATDTSSQIYVKASTANALTLTTLGYVNPHVSPNF